MQPSVLLGIGLLIIGNVFSALYDVSVKWLPSNADAASFLLIRQVLSVLMMLPLWLYSGRSQTSHYKMHFFRANIGAIGGLCFIIGLMSLPLATAGALFFSGPIMIMVLGALLLKEKVTSLQWIAVFLGFIGIVILLRPTQINWFAVIVLVSALTFAVSQLTLKKLPSTENPALTLMLNNLFSLPLVCLMVVFFGELTISVDIILVALMSNIFLLIYQWFCFCAYRKTQASDIAIAEYTGLLFCVFFGWLWFDEWLDGLSWLGAGLIILPSLVLPYITHQWRKLQGHKLALAKKSHPIISGK